MLTEQEKNIAANILANASLPVKDAPTVIAIINKLQMPTTEVKKDAKI